MTQNDDTGRTAHHYRAYLPAGIATAVGGVVACILLPLYWLLPPPLGMLILLFVSISLANTFLRRKVVLSSDGRLTVTELGRHIDVDAGRLTEINVSAFARWGFGLARFHWPGGGFWMWQRLAYLPNPRRRFSESGASQNVSESFRDLVYRLHLINPAMRIHGVAPPPWALRNPTPNHPHPTDQQHL